MHRSDSTHSRLRWLVVITIVAAVAASAAIVTSQDERSPHNPGSSPAALSGSEATNTNPAGALPQGAETVPLDPARFASTVDHPYWPMAPGSRWVYRETDGEGGEQRVVVTVTDETKEIMGVRARVVHDVVSEDGQVVEDTYDWYAQDQDGNLWYLGEDTKEYEEGKLASTEGSWQAGVDGAQAGIILPAEPQPGMTYRQEYLAGEAEDAARILSLDEMVTVPYGDFAGVLMTKDYTPLTPSLLEHKFYAPGVGPVLALTIAGGADREELLSFTAGR